MEEKLYSKKGLKVKEWWFCLRARQISGKLQPEANFSYSDAWFSVFDKVQSPEHETCNQLLSEGTSR